MSQPPRPSSSGFGLGDSAFPSQAMSRAGSSLSGLAGNSRPGSSSWKGPTWTPLPSIPGTDKGSTVDTKSTVEFINTAINEMKDDGKILLAYLHDFNSANEDPKASPNYVKGESDPMAPLLQFVCQKSLVDNPTLLLHVLVSLKILSRKRENRLQFTEDSIQALVSIASSSQSEPISCECSSVLLNICYERVNVEMLLKTEALSVLVGFLLSGGSDLQAVSAGAIQSVCYQEPGRKSFRDLGAIPDLVTLLSSPNPKVQARVVGAIHNITTDAQCINIIRKSRGIPPLIGLLSSPNFSTASSAAGAIQNISRDTECQKIMRDAGAVGPLTNLLFSSDVTSQSCALGALMNILGNEIGEEGPRPSRVALRKLLENGMILGMLYNGMFEQGNDARPSTGKDPSQAEPKD